MHTKNSSFKLTYEALLNFIDLSAIQTNAIDYHRKNKTTKANQRLINGLSEAQTELLVDKLMDHAKCFSFLLYIHTL